MDRRQVLRRSASGLALALAITMGWPAALPALAQAPGQTAQTAQSAETAQTAQTAQSAETAGTAQTAQTAKTATGRAGDPAPSWSLEAQRRLQSGTGTDAAADLAERLRLVQAAEAALLAGDVEAALRDFERASGLLHSQDVEMGIVRAQMQAGRYRQALSFASHAAGAHVNAPAGTALYVWLLYVGGQTNAARRYLQEGLQRHPGDATLLAAQTLLASPYPFPGAELLAAPLRAAPYSHGASPPAQAVFAGTALLLTDGGAATASSRARVPADTVRGARRIWVRNGLGETSLAQVDDSTAAMAAPGANNIANNSMATSAADGATLDLRLARPLPLPAHAVRPVGQPPLRPAFAGSPAYVVEFAAEPGQADGPAWPVLRQGFFGHLPVGTGLRRLSMDLSEGPRGGPVFDSQGGLTGLAVPLPTGQVAVVDGRPSGPAEASGLALALALTPAPAQTTGPDAAAANPRPAAPVDSPPRRAAGVDQIFEAGLCHALQVIVLR